MGHKKRHKQKHHKHTSPHVPAPAISSGAAENTTADASPRTKNQFALLVVTVFLFGICLGVIVGAFFLHLQPSAVFASSAVNGEDVTEPDALEKATSTESVIPKLETIITETSSTTALYNFITGSATATSSPQSLRVPTVVYHSVRPHVKGESKYQDEYDVTPELLREELIYMRDHGYTTISYRDLYEYWQGATTTFPTKPVLLTFDDGWRNQYQYAFPLLKEFHMKGVFFVFTNPIDHKKAHWMSWDELRQMDQEGMEIGGHSRTHPMMNKMTDDAALDYEIKEPKAIIEKELGHPILAFAYPFGSRNDHVFSALSRAEYKFARTLISGVWNDPLHNLSMHGTLATDNIKDFIRLLDHK